MTAFREDIGAPINVRFLEAICKLRILALPWRRRASMHLGRKGIFSSFADARSCRASSSTTWSCRSAHGPSPREAQRSERRRAAPRDRSHCLIRRRRNSAQPGDFQHRRIPVRVHDLDRMVKGVADEVGFLGGGAQVQAAVGGRVPVRGLDREARQQAVGVPRPDRRDPPPSAGRMLTSERPRRSQGRTCSPAAAESQRSCRAAP